MVPQGRGKVRVAAIEWTLNESILWLAKEVTKHKTISQNCLPGFNLYTPRKHGTGIHKRMELSVLPATIYGMRQVFEKSRVEFPAGKFWRELPGINTCDPCPEAGRDHFFGEGLGWQTP